MTEHHWQDEHPDTCPTCGRPWHRAPLPTPRGPGSTPQGRAAARAAYLEALRRRQETRP